MRPTALSLHEADQCHKILTLGVTTQLRNAPCELRRRNCSTFVRIYQVEEFLSLARLDAQQ